MKTLFGKAIAALLALGLVVGPTPALAQGYYFWFQVKTEDGEPFQEEGAVRCSVYGRDATTGYATVHTTAALTTPYTLPLASSVNGLIHWYSSSEAPVNLKCFTQYGDYAYKNNFSRQRHQVQIDTSSAYKIFRFPYVTNTAPTATGLIIPSGGIVTGAAVERITILDGAHINVGFAGNHAVASWNAVVSQLDISQRGFAMVHFSGSTGADLSAPIAAAGSHLGLALRHMVGQPSRSFVSRPYLVHVSSGLELTYTTSAGAGIGGHVYIYWTQTHVGSNRQPYR
jgi:hypothetical protein